MMIKGYFKRWAQILVGWICVKVLRMQELEVSFGAGTNCKTTHRAFMIGWTTSRIEITHVAESREMRQIHETCR